MCLPCEKGGGSKSRRDCTHPHLARFPERSSHETSHSCGPVGRHPVRQLHPRCLCRLFEIQLTAHGNAEYVDAGLCAPGHQGLENLLRASSQSFGGVKTAQVIFVKFVKMLPAGDFSLLHQPDGVRFFSHIPITVGIIRHFPFHCNGYFCPNGEYCMKITTGGISWTSAIRSRRSV